MPGATSGPKPSRDGTPATLAAGVCSPTVRSCGNRGRVPRSVLKLGVGVMTSEIQLRPGVVFRTDAAGLGSIEFPKGRHFDKVSFLGAIPGTTDNGAPARVNVLRAIYPTSADKKRNWEHLPVLGGCPRGNPLSEGPRRGPILPVLPGIDG